MKYLYYVLVILMNKPKMHSTKQKNSGVLYKYFCDDCNYRTDIKQNFDRHVSTKKHIETNNIVNSVTNNSSYNTTNNDTTNTTNNNGDTINIFIDGKTLDKVKFLNKYCSDNKPLEYPKKELDFHKH